MTELRVTLTVLQDDIDNGVPKHPAQCAVALAVKRELGTAPTVGSAVRFTADGQRWLAVPPDKVYEFIRDFDRSEPVEPFKVELRCVPDTQVTTYPPLASWEATAL